MRLNKSVVIFAIVSAIFSFQWISAIAGESRNMAEAMREAGFTAQTAQWVSVTSQDDSKGATRRTTSRFWMSGSQFRMEMQDEAQKTTVMIDDGKQQYMYDPQKKTAMLLNEMMRSMYSGFFSSDLYKQAAQQRKTAKQSGKEVINGKPCSILEYQNNIGNVVSNVKEWVWVEKQFPMKSIVTMPKQTMSMMGQTVTMPASTTETVVTEVTLDKPVDAAMFQLPSGVKVQTMEESFDEEE